MNIIKNIYEISAKKKILESYDMKTLTAVAHNLYIPESKINKEELINNILYRKYMELLLYINNDCFNFIRRFLTYEDDINLMKTCKTLRKRIINKNYWCDMHKLSYTLKKSNPNFIKNKIYQINQIFKNNEFLEYHIRTIIMIINNLLYKTKMLNSPKSKKKMFKIIINFTLERDHFLRNDLNFARVVYDKLLEYEDDIRINNYVIDAKNKFLKLGISLE